jgi:hypothetical protein
MSSVALTLYPSLINRACAVLDERPDVRNQPEGYLRVMLRIVKKINLAAPMSPIFAKRSTLATESGKSIETVHRTIKWLESEGLIERKQKAHPGRRGSSSPLVPTMKFLRELLLDPESIARSYRECEDYIGKKQQARAEKNACKPTASHETASADTPADISATADVCPAEATAAPDLDATVEVAEPAATAEAVTADLPRETTVESTQVAAEQPAPKTSAQRQAERDHNRGFVKLENVKIPQDLAWLVTDLDMRATGVLQLMSMAKQAKQRLSDVVAATGKYLQDLPGREAYAYIKSLLKKGQDFAYKVRATNDANKEEQERAYLAQKAEAMAGRSFANRDGSMVVTVEANGMLVMVRNGQRAAKRITHSFLDAIDAGRLIAHREWV